MSSQIPVPPPPPPTAFTPPRHTSQPTPPSVPPDGPDGAFLLELITANGHPFKDHWSYFVRSRQHPDVGVVLHATGDVRNGFVFEVKRAFNLALPENRPSKRISLQLIDGKHFDEQRMLNGGVLTFDATPVCAFEESVHKVAVPGKTLNTVGEEGGGGVGRKVAQRNCQTWIVESAEKLVADGMLSRDVAAHLRAIEQ